MGVVPSQGRLAFAPTPDPHAFEFDMPSASKSDSSPAPKRWLPRPWLGSEFSGLMRLMLKNRFAVAPRYWGIAAADVLVSMGNSTARVLQELVYGRQIERTELEGDPIFIIGHWRTGTTLLHELLIRDERYGYPNTYHCFSPNHFLLTESLAHRWLNFLIVGQRIMDNMEQGWGRPQEDEFAFCNMGLPSPYRTTAFPNHPPHGTFDLEELPERDRERWRRKFVWFLKAVTVQHRKRLVLKSPPHMARVKTLLEWFPDAKFVHIVRDPYVVYSSTIHLWQKFYRNLSFQVPRFEGLHEYVLDTYDQLYNKLEEARPLVPPGQFHELRYEELVEDPFGELKKVYDALELEGFEAVRPAIAEYLESVGDYKTNRYELDDAVRDEIARRWAPHIRRYGYAQEETAEAADTHSASEPSRAS